jgi:hypothetical protein
VVRWLNDTPFYRGSLEILAEKPRYFWWSQQIDLGTLPWSMFLAIEGRRRRIPRLWTFFALAQLVNLSYAQNLFYVAVLLTPVPLPTDVQNLTRSPAPISSSRSVYSWLIRASIAKPKPDSHNSRIQSFRRGRKAGFQTHFSTCS